MEYVSVLAFWTVWWALLAQRMVEVWASSRTTRALVAAGGRRVVPDGYGLLAATHATFFAATAAEAWTAPWAGAQPDRLSALGLLVLIAGEVLRVWAVAALGDRWTTRIVVVPDAPLVRSGPYQWLRHPIYVGVTLMLAGFLLMFHLWASLAIVAVLHAVSLTRRIRLEQAALVAVVPRAPASAPDDA